MENNLRKIIIDGQEIGVNPAMTILQACEYIDKEIPRFCTICTDVSSNKFYFNFVLLESEIGYCFLTTHYCYVSFL